MKTEQSRILEKKPSAWVSLIPLLVLVVLLVLVIHSYGSDALSGASQVALLLSAAVCVALSMGVYGCKWQRLEDEVVENVKSSAVAIIILLFIGSIAGTWMLSGVVPTLICYGLEVLDPSWFLAASCLICSLVSLMTGSSWTTIATIGVALMGIGSALGFSEGWVAGAVISGSYFGDKFSPLSDTNVLVASATEVPLFEHIKYMVYTTLPTIVITLAVFLVASLLHPTHSSGDSLLYSQTLKATFNISPWLLIVPLLTGVMIYKKLPALVTLFLSTLFAVVAMLIAQPHLLVEIAADSTGGFWTSLRAAINSCFSSTAIQTDVPAVNELISTRGMSGMMDTIWLIICAMCFGGVMTGSGMLSSLTNVLLRYVKRTTSAVAATVGAGVLFNMTTSDQYIAIIISGRLFKDMYRNLGLEPRLLSRSVVDSATVTSVLVPWSSCGMVQATVLGVPTLVYLPYCVFNYLSPIVTIAVAALGYKIYRVAKSKE